MPPLGRIMTSSPRGLALDVPVEPGGYAWWYLDGVAEDRDLAITVIAMVGNAFSPFYARQRRLGRDTDPLQFSALNVVLYRRRAKRWTFNEVPLTADSRRPTELGLGGGRWSWTEDHLTVDFDQRSPVLGLRLAGTVRLYPRALFGEPVALDPQANHLWYPIAPRAKIEVDLKHPRLRFSGSGYHDANAGNQPLADGFHRWQWSRSELAEGAAVIYHADQRGGGVFSLAQCYRDDGTSFPLEVPRRVTLPSTRWRVARSTRVDHDGAAQLRRTFENSPFYCRSMLDAQIAGQRATVIHESLDLDRLRNRLVQSLFYLRMRRAVSWAATPTLGAWARLRP